MTKHLPFAASKMILRLAVANASNAEINAELMETGYRAVSDVTLSRYRKSKYVQRAQQAGYEQAVQMGILERGRRLMALNGVATELFRRLEGRGSEGSEAFPSAVSIDDILKATRALIPVLAEVRTLQQPFFDSRNAATYGKSLEQQRGEKRIAAQEGAQQVSQDVLYSLLVDSLRDFIKEEGYLDETVEPVSVAADEAENVENKMIGEE